MTPAAAVSPLNHSSAVRRTSAHPVQGLQRLGSGRAVWGRDPPSPGPHPHTRYLSAQQLCNPPRLPSTTT